MRVRVTWRVLFNRSLRQDSQVGDAALAQLGFQVCRSIFRSPPVLQPLAHLRRMKVKQGQGEIGAEVGGYRAREERGAVGERGEDGLRTV